jgi:hypothetical protein
MPIRQRAFRYFHGCRSDEYRADQAAAFQCSHERHSDGYCSKGLLRRSDDRPSSAPTGAARPDSMRSGAYRPPLRLTIKPAGSYFVVLNRQKAISFVKCTNILPSYV